METGLYSAHVCRLQTTNSHKTIDGKQRLLKVRQETRKNVTTTVTQQNTGHKTLDIAVVKPSTSHVQDDQKKGELSLNDVQTDRKISDKAANVDDVTVKQSTIYYLLLVNKNRGPENYILV